MADHSRISDIQLPVILWLLSYRGKYQSALLAAFVERKDIKCSLSHPSDIVSLFIELDAYQKSMALVHSILCC